MGKAKFTVTCPEMAFSQSHEIPLDARGYVHSLAEELSKAFDRYKDKVEIHKIKTQMNVIKDCAYIVSQQYVLPLDQTDSLKTLLNLINEVDSA